MTNDVLVTYATYTGSTAGVAQAIGDTLAEDGFNVTVKAMQDVTDVRPYDAVVAGSAIHGSAWLPEAMQFVETHRDALAQRPFAAFLVCMTLALKNKKWVERARVHEWLNPVSALVPTVSEGYFAGILDISKIPPNMGKLGFRISTWLGVWKSGDHRDWDAIRAWARELAPNLETSRRVQQDETGS